MKRDPSELVTIGMIIAVILGLTVLFTIRTIEHTGTAEPTVSASPDPVFHTNWYGEPKCVLSKDATVVMKEYIYDSVKFDTQNTYVVSESPSSGYFVAETENDGIIIIYINRATGQKSAANKTARVDTYLYTPEEESYPGIDTDSDAYEEATRCIDG